MSRYIYDADEHEIEGLSGSAGSYHSTIESLQNMRRQLLNMMNEALGLRIAGRNARVRLSEEFHVMNAAVYAEEQRLRREAQRRLDPTPRWRHRRR